MKDSDVLIMNEPRLSLGDQFYLPQVLKGLGTTMKHMLTTLAGTASIYQENRLQWIMRDAAVVTQHHFVSEATYDSAGALFAGLPPGTPYP